MKLLATALLAALLASTTFAAKPATTESVTPSSMRHLAAGVRDASTPTDLAARFSSPTFPTERLVKLASAGLKIDSPNLPRTALKLGSGLGTTGPSVTRGLNWHARVNVTW